jgi:hypothetical protein
VSFPNNNLLLARVCCFEEVRHRSVLLGVAWLTGDGEKRKVIAGMAAGGSRHLCGLVQIPHREQLKSLDRSAGEVVRQLFVLC